MKLRLPVCLILTVACIQVGASAIGQQITLSEKNATLEHVLKRLRKQSNVDFICSSEQMQRAVRVTVNVTDQPLKEVLDKVFESQPLVYTLKNRTIVVQDKPVAVVDLPSEYPAIPADIALSGVVRDSTGEELPGVNVILKGTRQGTTTDRNGQFSLNVPDERAVLVFSFVGYVTKEVTVGKQTQLNIRLDVDNKALEEVVVVGYGTEKKVNLTGAVSTINMSKIAESRPITSLSTSLYGLVPGLSVNQGNARPGRDGATLLIRGQGTLNNSSPLVIVDGVESNMNDLNPQDVETISVLKDAASAAIYGSRAANGVILITTKKGSEGSLKLSYNGYMAAQKATRLVEMVSDYATHMELYNESVVNTNPGGLKPFEQKYIDEWRADAGKNPLVYSNVDWRELFGNNVISQNHNLSISGGTEKLKVFSSFGFLDNPGILENTGFKRFSGRINMEARVKPYLTLGMLASGNHSRNDIGVDRLDGNRALRWIVTTNPSMIYRHPDGRYGASNDPLGGGAGTNNALATVNSVKGDIFNNRLAARFYGILNPLKGLTLESSYTNEQTSYLKEQMPVYLDRWNFYTNTIVAVGAGRTSVDNSSSRTYRNFMDGIVRYKNIFAGHLDFHIMAGASQEYYKSSNFAAFKQDLTDPSLTVLDAATMDADVSGNASDWAMRSYFGRLNLKWQDKYLLEGNLRYDGSSRFRAGKTRWGLFPSLSAGWRISEEELLKRTSWIDELKIRASYGALGNNSIGNYDYQALYGSANYVLNGTLQTGFAQTALANSIITWESTYVTNFGLDFGLFKNHITGSLELFNKDTRNILIGLPAPNVRGTASLPRQNAARVRNRGAELNLTWNNRIGEVSYQIGGNVAYVKNKVTKFKGPEMSISGTDLLLEGESINVLYVLAADRILQTDADMGIVQQMIDNAPIDPATGNKRNPFAAFGTPQRGDLLYKDLNGDGIVDNQDRYILGTGGVPLLNYGIQLGLQWKGFDFACLLQGTSSLKDFWMDDWRTPTPATTNLVSKEIADGRWYTGRTDATYPRLLTSAAAINKANSDFWVVDKAYLRVKNIQLGYRIPKNISRKLAVESIRLYGSLENFLTFTKYTGFDPEIRGGNSGIDSFNYPTMKQSTLGINIDF